MGQLATLVNLLLEKLSRVWVSFDLGGSVCFTGTANKARLESMARGAGLEPVRSVTKKRCDLLVAADVATSSSKARNARKWDIPIMSAQEFLERFHSD